MNIVYAIFSNSEKNNLDPDRAFEAKYTGICFNLPSSSFSCTRSALTVELEADKYNRSGDLGSSGHSFVMIDK
jgi:hypothetical protein